MNADTPPLRPDADPGQPPAKVQWPYTETDLYLVVTRGWCELPSRQARREHPIGGYIFGWHFVASVERTPVPVPIVARTILKVVCRRDSPNDGAVSLALRESVEANRVRHTLLSDPSLLFYPVASAARNPAQVVAWAKVQDSRCW
jgi:hypothetical protein